ncbi:TDT family transporter [uncultured Clostridium sp.]|uniref:TDT family transporter n=1 Tax=uncultured Clostridium sp. TaxID=59620 RepID=UPI00261054F0|nr:TDT family transporter [uncultured Clostridium sp.]
MKNLFRKLENYPIGMCGIALGVITLSNCFTSLGYPYFTTAAITFGIIALYIMVLKVIIYPRKVVEELKSPVLGSFYPTFDMALFLIAAYLYKGDPLMGKILWFSAIVIHVALFLIFFGFRARKFKMEDMLPSWFIQLVGMVVGTVSGMEMGYKNIALALLIVGTVLYVIVWPFMLYRLFKKDKINENISPAIAVLSAPASLCISGYLAYTNTPNEIILGILFITSIFNLVYVYIKIPRSLKNGFLPIQASFTFPLAISLLAMLKMASYVDFIGYTTVGVIFRGLAIFELVITTALILYVLVNFLIMFIKAVKESFKNKEHIEIAE